VPGLTEEEAAQLRKRHRLLRWLLAGWVASLVLGDFWWWEPTTELRALGLAALVLGPLVGLLLALWVVERRIYQAAAGAGTRRSKVVWAGRFLPFGRGWQVERLLQMAIELGKDPAA
jgi:hypothetical protein